MDQIDPSAPRVIVDGPAGEAFLAFYSLARDVDLARAYLRQLIARPSLDVPHENDYTATALWTAAVMSYGRCFKGGRRYRFAQTIAIPTDVHETHRWMLTLRDKFYAHLDPNVMLQQEWAFLELAKGQPRGVRHLAAPWFQGNHPPRDQIDGAVALCDRIYPLFEDASNAAGQAILRHARTVDLVELYRRATAAEPLEVDVPEGDGL